MKRKPRREYDPLPRRDDRLTLRRGPDGAYEPLPRRDARETHVGNGSGGDCAIAMRVKKGRRVGRLKGVPNKLTRVLREAILLAAEQCPHSRGRGLVGYLTFLATEHPRTFSRSLLARLIPHDLRLRAEVTAPLESAAEIRAQLIARGIPIPERLFELPSLPDQPPRHDSPAPQSGDPPPAADPCPPTLPVPSYTPSEPQPRLRLVNNNAYEEDPDHVR